MRLSFIALAMSVLSMSASEFDIAHLYAAKNNPKYNWINSAGYVNRYLQKHGKRPKG